MIDINSGDIYQLLDLCKSWISEKEYNRVKNDTDFNRLLIAQSILKRMLKKIYRGIDGKDNT